MDNTTCIFSLENVIENNLVISVQRLFKQQCSV